MVPESARKAREFGLEGFVSKHRDRPYQSGRSKHWIKIKNRKHDAFYRVQEAHASARPVSKADTSKTRIILIRITDAASRFAYPACLSATASKWLGRLEVAREGRPDFSACGRPTSRGMEKFKPKVRTGWRVRASTGSSLDQMPSYLGRTGSTMHLIVCRKLTAAPGDAFMVCRGCANRTNKEAVTAVMTASSFIGRRVSMSRHGHQQLACTSRSGQGLVCVKCLR